MPPHECKACPPPTFRPFRPFRLQAGDVWRPRARWPACSPCNHHDSITLRNASWSRQPATGGQAQGADSEGRHKDGEPDGEALVSNSHRRQERARRCCGHLTKDCIRNEYSAQQQRRRPDHAHLSGPSARPKTNLYLLHYDAGTGNAVVVARVGVSRRDSRVPPPTSSSTKSTHAPCKRTSLCGRCVSSSKDHIRGM